MRIKSIIYSIPVFFLLSACNDEFLERYPLAELAPENSFKSEIELQAYTNAFYNQLPTALDIFYNAPVFADDDARVTVPDEIRGSRTVPTTGGGWSWSALRRINFFLENSHNFPNEEIRVKYDGLARFFRAYFYYDKIQRFGDVPWYDRVLATDDEAELMKARDPRSFVVERMLEDLDYAIAHLDNERHAQRITKWTALAFKSRVCLFEGTFRKYHGLPGWESLLQECVEASEELMNNSGYGIYKSTPDGAYHELFIAEDAITQEMILARQYSSSIPLVHDVNFYTLSVSFGRPGVLRQVINSYLNADGTRFTDDPNYQTTPWYEEFQNRDPRLKQTVRGPGYRRPGDTSPTLPDFSASITGYQYIKYIQEDNFMKRNCENDMPIFRYAETLLNFVEAKAELQILTQNDIDRSIKLLRDRVGMPNLNLASANADPDPYLANQYPKVSGQNRGIILEIRRERRIELIREGLRWHDLLRWKEGQLLARTFHGMYFPGAGEYDIDHNGTIDLHIYQGSRPPAVPGRQYISLGEVTLEHGGSGGQIVVNPTVSKRWNENRDYLYPIPIQERLLNPALSQNPGWDDGIDR